MDTPNRNRRTAQTRLHSVEDARSADRLIGRLERAGPGAMLIYDGSSISIYPSRAGYHPGVSGIGYVKVVLSLRNGEQSVSEARRDLRGGSEGKKRAEAGSVSAPREGLFLLDRDGGAGGALDPVHADDDRPDAGAQGAVR